MCVYMREEIKLLFLLQFLWCTGLSHLNPEVVNQQFPFRFWRNINK